MFCLLLFGLKWCVCVCGEGLGKRTKVYTRSKTEFYWLFKCLEMVQQLSEKHSFPLKTSFNNSRGFYIQLYTGPGANDRLDCINVLMCIHLQILHTCPCVTVYNYMYMYM